MADLKVRSICVDTLTGIQNEQWMRSQKKAGHDDWMDFGKDIYTFIAEIQDMGFEIVLILGEPGTGKSSGMRTLPHDSNIWYNADKKNPVWTGGREEYGRKNAPRKPFHIIPDDYSDIISHVKHGIETGMFEEDRFAFITGHVEQYKGTGSTVLERLKTLGKVGTKMQLEGKMETVFYSSVRMDGKTPVYELNTQNSGYNTARSPMGLFDAAIPNDYAYVIEKLSGGY